MSMLLDTNILTRSAQPGHPMHKDAVDGLDMLRTRGEELCVVPQNLIEFWAVATRPVSANGLGMTTGQTQAELARIKSLFRLLPDTGDLRRMGDARWAASRFGKEHTRCADRCGDERSRRHQSFDLQRR